MVKKIVLGVSMTIAMLHSGNIIPTATQNLISYSGNNVENNNDNGDVILPMPSIEQTVGSVNSLDEAEHQKIEAFTKAHKGVYLNTAPQSSVRIATPDTRDIAIPPTYTFTQRDGSAREDLEAGLSHIAQSNSGYLEKVFVTTGTPTTLKFNDKNILYMTNCSTKYIIKNINHEIMWKLNGDNGAVMELPTITPSNSNTLLLDLFYRKKDGNDEAGIMYGNLTQDNIKHFEDVWFNADDPNLLSGNGNYIHYDSIDIYIAPSMQRVDNRANPRTYSVWY